MRKRHDNVFRELDSETKLHIAKTRQYIHRQVKAMVHDPVKTGMELRGVAATFRDKNSSSAARSRTPPASAAAASRRGGGASSIRRQPTARHHDVSNASSGAAGGDDDWRFGFY